MWETEEGRGRDGPSNEKLVSDLGVGLRLGCLVTHFLHLEFYSLYSPSCRLL